MEGTYRLVDEFAFRKTSGKPPITRERMMRSLRRFGLVLGLSLAGFSSAIASPVFSVGSGSGYVGQSFTVPVTISADTAVMFWQFDIHYDPVLFRVDSVTEGDFMSAYGATLFIPGFIDNANGLVSLVANAYIDLPPEPYGEGVLANIAFTALGVGRSTVSLEGVILNLGADGHVGLVNGEILGIPEPAPYLLVTTALAAMILSRRRATLQPNAA